LYLSSPDPAVLPLSTGDQKTPAARPEHSRKPTWEWQWLPRLNTGSLALAMASHRG